MSKKIIKFIRGFIFYFGFGFLLSLVLELMPTKILYASLPKFLLLIIIFLILPITEKILQKTSIGSNVRIRKFYNLFKIAFSSFIIVAVTLYILTYIFIARPYQTGAGMEPTIKKDSYVLNLLLPLRFTNPARLDIVTFRCPYADEKDCVSRIIGVPGDKIILKDGYVYLNGNGKVNRSK